MPRYEENRPWRYLYNSAAWKIGRARHLRANPLCEFCKIEKPPRYTPATVVDHRIPHKGSHALFFAETNWQSLCKPHHDGLKAAQERAELSTRTAYGEDGWPIQQ